MINIMGKNMIEMSDVVNNIVSPRLAIGKKIKFSEDKGNVWNEAIVKEEYPLYYVIDVLKMFGKYSYTILKVDLMTNTVIIK